MSVRRAFGLAEYVDVGCEVWSTREGETRDVLGQPVHPHGGTVVHIVDATDPDTGEILRAFRCLSAPHQYTPYLHFHTVPDGDVDKDTINVPPQSALTALARQAATEVFDRTGQPTRREILLVDAVAALLHVTYSGVALEGVHLQPCGPRLLQWLPDDEVAGVWRRLLGRVAYHHGPIDTRTIERALLCRELVSLVASEGGPLHVDLSRADEQVEPEPRPTYPPNVEGLTG